MTMRQCWECRFWDNSTADTLVGSFGNCDAAAGDEDGNPEDEGAEPLALAVIVWDSPDTSGTLGTLLKTSPYFGCVMWQPKAIDNPQAGNVAS